MQIVSVSSESSLRVVLRVSKTSIRPQLILLRDKDIWTDQ